MKKKIGKEKIEYNKNSGYFIINSQNQLFHLTEEQVKEKLRVKKLNLKNPEKIIRRYGEKKEKSTFYKIIDVWRANLSIVIFCSNYCSDYFDYKHNNFKK